jgi:MYXO-CTERM domain-containing protein
MTAIAAVLAVVATPAIAQDATVVTAPAVEAAAPAPAEAPSPATVTVTTNEPVVQAAPIVVPEPAAEPSEPATTAAVAATSSASGARRMASAAAPVVSRESATVASATAASTVANPAPADVDPALAPLIDEPPVAAAPAAQTDAQFAPAEPAGDNTAALGGLAALLALGGLGAFALRRRRRSDVAVRETPPLAVSAPVTAHAPLRAKADPVIAAAPRFERPAPRIAPGMTSAAMIPAGPLPQGQAMVDLHERMVRAAPDADNPFVALKRRRKRVRWLLKQHEYGLRRESTRPFDFRAYRPSSELSREEAFIDNRDAVPA